MEQTLPGADYYAQNYPDYALQNSEEKIAFYLGLLQKHVTPGAQIFELGVGLGRFIQAAAAHYAVQGADVNAYGVECTRSQVPTAKLTVGSFEQIPTSGVQAVVSFDVLEHIPDLKLALQTIYDRLPTGGALIGVVPVYDGPLGWLVRRLDKDPTHLTKTSRAAWLTLLRDTGFEIAEWGGILRKLVGQTYLHWTAPQWALRPVGSALYFVARKN